MLTKEELEALDNWRFAKRMPSRAAAIRELLKRGLNAEGFNVADGAAKSEDFGVTDRAASAPPGRRERINPWLAPDFLLSDLGERKELHPA